MHDCAVTLSTKESLALWAVAQGITDAVLVSVNMLENSQLLADGMRDAGLRAIQDVNLEAFEVIPHHLQIIQAEPIGSIDVVSYITNAPRELQPVPPKLSPELLRFIDAELTALSLSTTDAQLAAWGLL